MRSIEEIYESMAGRFSETSGTALIEGGDMSLRLWALAGEIFTLEVQADFVARQSFPQTATGEFLDRHAEMRALSRAGAEKAAGTLRFYLDQENGEDIEVPEGTVCMNAAEAQFVTTQDGTIRAGTTWCDVCAEASEAGSGGNVPAGSVRWCVLLPAGVAGVTNPAAFAGGRDAESDESLRQRVLGSYQSLPNGANRAYYESKVLENSAAEAVAVLPKLRGPGTVDVCFATAAGAPDKEEIAKVQQLLDGEREICVDIEVKAPETVEVDVAAQITVSEGFSFDAVKTAAEQALRACFGGKMLGRNVYRAYLTAALMGVDGVENCALVSPEKDVTVGEAQLPVPVSLSVEEIASLDADKAGSLDAGVMESPGADKAKSRDAEDADSPRADKTGNLGAEGAGSLRTDKAEDPGAKEAESPDMKEVDSPSAEKTDIPDAEKAGSLSAEEAEGRNMEDTERPGAEEAV